MSYISEIFERSSIEQIRGFLLSGLENHENTNQIYQQRIDDAQK